MNAIYSYSEQHIKSRLEMYNRLETRIFGILTFAGVALTVVGTSLPIQQKSGIFLYISSASLVIQIIALGNIIVSIIPLIEEVKFSLGAKMPSLNSIYKVEGIFNKSEEKFQKTIFSSLMKIENDIAIAIDRRGKVINDSLFYLKIAAILYVFNISLMAITTILLSWKII
jgi:hypothetical protein